MTLNQAPPQHGLAKAIRSRQGDAAIPGEEDADSARQRRWTLDFAGGKLTALSPDAAVALRIARSTEAPPPPHVQPLPNHQWRATFRVGAIRQPLDIRLALTLQGQAISETWSHIIPVSLTQAPPDA